MRELVRYIVTMLMSLCLLTETAPALTRKVKPTGDGKSTTSDSVKIAPVRRDSATKTLLPAMPSWGDSVSKGQLTPTKLNDFVDKNKNGIDDRLEKTIGEPKKPVVLPPSVKSKPKSTETKKPAETKKSNSESVSKISSKKSK